MIKPPPERWIHEEWYGTLPMAFALFTNFPFHIGSKDEPGKYHTTKLGFISGIDQFDPLEFGISAKEAACYDPAIRLSLEAAHAVRPLYCTFPSQPLIKSPIGATRFRY